MIVRMRKILSLLKNRIKVHIKQLTPAKLIKGFAPPIMLGLVNLFRNLTFSSTGYYFGVYSSFKDCREQNEELLSKSGSFNNPDYGEWSLQQAKNFLAKSLWELPDNQNLIKFLTRVSLELGRKGSLRIFDFGGGVGYHYIRCQRYLNNPQIDYTVFDMPEIVARGKKFFRGKEGIHFIDSMPPPEETKFDMILLSSVLQYIDDWQKLLKDITTGYKPDILFLMRLQAGDIPDFVTMQTIPTASFPAHCFNYTKLKEFCLSLSYTIEDKWDEGESLDLYDKGRRYVIPRYKGLILRRIK